MLQLYNARVHAHASLQNMYQFYENTPEQFWLLAVLFMFNFSRSQSYTKALQSGLHLVISKPIPEKPRALQANTQEY